MLGGSVQPAGVQHACSPLCQPAPRQHDVSASCMPCIFAVEQVKLNDSKLARLMNQPASKFASAYASAGCIVVGLLLKMLMLAELAKS